MRLLAGRAILVVDREAASLACWRQRLLAAGARVIGSSSADSALANAVTFPAGTFHAALIEHRPPRLDAIELVAALRALQDMRALPVIVVGEPGAGPAPVEAPVEGTVWLARPAAGEQAAAWLAAAFAPISVPAAQAPGTRETVPAAPSSGPIDWSQVESLRSVDRGGINGIVGKAIGLYIDHAPRLIEEILTYRITGDLKDVRRAAHSLGSSSASLGAGAVARLSAVIESAAAKSDFEIIDSVAADLQAEYRRAESALRSALSH